MEQQSPTPERRPDDVTPTAPPAADAPGSPTGSPAAEAAPPLTPMGWLQQNSPFLVAFIAGVALLYYYGGFNAVYRAALVVLGLGLLIFIHELGHFLAAKWCNVHVQTFSLGFGPALPGCSFRWGETLYKIGILPLGGFVQMVGEGADADEDENYPRSYKNKTVLQRMLIISAGVVMNVLLGFVCFVIVYLHGLPMPPAAVGATDAGSPAWQAGIPSGSVFTKIGSTAAPNFDDLRDNVALTLTASPVPVEYKAPGDDQIRATSLLPRRDANDKQPVIGVSPPSELALRPKKYLPDEYARPVLRGSAAEAGRVLDLHPGDVVVQASDPTRDGDPVTDLPHDSPGAMYDALADRVRGLVGRDMVLRVRRADAAPNSSPVEIRAPMQGFEPGDQIVSMTDPDTPDDPYHVTALRRRPVPTANTEAAFDIYDFQDRMKRLAGRAVVVGVLREANGPGEAVTSTVANVFVPPAFHRRLGLKMKMGLVAAVRDHSPASGLVRPGDKIVAASVTEGDKPLGEELKEEVLDPVRLPYELEKRVAQAKDRSSVRVVLTVSRHDADTLGDKETKLTLPWDDGWRFDRELSFLPASPMAIPELGLAYHVESEAARVDPDSPAGKAGVQPNDRFEEIAYQEWGGDKWGRWATMKAQRTRDGATRDAWDEWPYYFTFVQENEAPGVKVRVWRGGARLPDDVEMTADEDRTWPLAERGLMLMPDSTLDKADGIVQAVEKGVHRTWSFIRQIYQGLVSMVMGRIDPASNLEGPVKIAEHTFQAAQDPFTLLLMLGMISVNLAVVNFLPIPVLDGGHMVFLLYELVRRKPPSDAVRAVASYVGLAVLGLLMLCVICLDIIHLWPW